MKPVKRKTALLVTEDDLLMDLAHHNIPPALLIEFSEKIVQPYYRGNLTTAINDLLQKALSEQDLHQRRIHASKIISVAAFAR